MNLFIFFFSGTSCHHFGYLFVQFCSKAMQHAQQCFGLVRSSHSRVASAMGTNTVDQFNDKCWHIIKVEALWFGCYGVIIWFLSGKNESKWFLLFSLSDIFFALFMCAIFSVRFTQTYYYHVTKELCAWLIMCYTFHIAAWYISVQFGKTKISSNFPLKVSVFVIFYEK